MDLEERINELETKQATLDASLALKDKEIETLKAENQTLIDDNQRLDKELTIMRANVQDEKEQIEVEKTVNDILSVANVSETFHDKIKSQFKDRKTGKYNVGAYQDKVAFENAFRSEVSDWESKVSSIGMGVGIGKSKEDTEKDINAGAFAAENAELLAPYKKKI